MRRRQPLCSNSEDDLLDEPLINLTPLIDVVFVVLISFVLIAPVLEIDSVILAPGSPACQKKRSPIQNGPLNIVIRKDNSIWFQGSPIGLHELESKLLLENRKSPHEIPQVIPDASSHFDTYIQVKNTLEACGFEQMDIILK